MYYLRTCKSVYIKQSFYSYVLFFLFFFNIIQLSLVLRCRAQLNGLAFVICRSMHLLHRMADLCLTLARYRVCVVCVCAYYSDHRSANMHCRPNHLEK